MKTKIIIAVLSIFMLAGCKKNGTGGKATIKGTVAHHSKNIANATVYIKYGATEFPGADVSKYDANVAADANGYFEIKNLRKGEYYVYGVGYDVAFQAMVYGGVPIKLRNKEVVETNVAVVE
jgi:hypothetical protein